MVRQRDSVQPILYCFSVKISCAARFALLGISFLLVIFFVGCKKKEANRLAPAQIHQITRDLAAAGRSAAPSGTEIHTGLQASDSDRQSTDSLDITLFSEGPDGSALPETTRVERSLGAVATRYGLTKMPLLCREGICFSYMKFSVRTHVIHFHIRPKLAQGSDSGARSSGPRLAIILDDLGSDRAAAEAVFALGYPLTISILPNHEHSADIAQEAHRRGFQVMLHLPMQSVANETPEARELRPGMPPPEVAAMVDRFLQNVPDAAGVNNHQGSQATADAALMDELMPVLRERHLFYVDSRTTAATVAYDTAQDFGVRSAFRNVPFLDDVAQVAAVRKQLELSLRGAREKGEAVAIGHPHPATLQALREVLPQAQAQGVRLVPASELTH
ncbi:MAG: hypothetical protein DMG48_11725 [Acidobacteria bacterium]|nr:MAG: hypothetical protein DMG48_11725 [Acidobacteriota bacterium]